MNLEITNNREIKPYKIAVKQFEADTTVLTFTRDSYIYDKTKDLRDYTAYAITCINGEIDMTELTKEVVGGKLVLTWSLSAQTLRHAGAIAYQISFKGEKGSPAVFNTYQGIIQNSASIDESELVGDYPTVMKQWLDLINARSGAMQNKVVYMLPGESVPVQERTFGTLYYQWEEVHSTSATAATGIVNLGASPYADSGLYINGKHVYVDDANDTVFVLEPSVWVETINAANCGVIASDVSTSDDVRILLTAATAGASGNSITYELALAQYGAGKGLNNPSGGTTQGATLIGGYDAQTGVDRPTGQFEDHFGNVLSRVDGVVSEIKYLASNKNPVGWLLCDGSEVSKTEYANLYNAIGDTWGEASDSTKFKLPDLIGRVAWGGEAAGTYIEAGLPNITGRSGPTENANGHGLVSQGALTTTHAFNYHIGGGGTGAYYFSDLDASKSNAIYGNSDTVQPPAATLRPFIKY